MSCVLLALFAGARSYAQDYYLFNGGGGYLSLYMDGTWDTSDPMNDRRGQMYIPSTLDAGGGNFVFQAAETGTLPPGLSITYASVYAYAKGIDPADDNEAFDDDLLGGAGIVSAVLPGFYWNLYSDVIVESWVEFSDGSWEDVAQEWQL